VAPGLSDAVRSLLAAVLLVALASPPARALDGRRLRVVDGRLPINWSATPGRYALLAAAGEERIVARPGTRFAVELDANATTGFRWRLGQPLDAHVVRLRGTEYRVRDPQRTGGGGTEVWTFEAVAPGRTAILFEYVRPWERETPPVRTRTVVVEVERSAPPAPPRPEDSRAR
jgi:predicted secreted protein